MDVDVTKIGVQMRRVMVFLTRTCYRSICNHPFLVGSVCFLIFLYRSSPFVFSLLVSASPILVCTAVLLGILLSFGQPNIPEIEKEEKVTTHEISSLKTGAVEDVNVVEGDENKIFETIQRYTEPPGNALDEPILDDNKGNQVEKDGGSIDFAPPLIGINSREIQCEKRVTEEVEREFNDLELENRRQVDEEKPRSEEKLNDGVFVDNLYSRVGAESLGLEDDKSPRELIDTLKEDQLGFALGSSWKLGEEDYGDDDGAHGDESLDSGSDGAESSSPDASMADILPMLDELHPLLELEAPRLTHVSIDGSDTDSQRLHNSNDESVDSGEDSDNQVEEGEGEDDSEDDEEEEEEEEEEEKGEAVKGEKEDESKSVIKWTEVDQRNLMDMGTSEIERNQRLENLIARRRARKTFRLMAEKNLIDLEDADLPFNIPLIATTRRNPFEVPDDTHENMAMPGSAPSIMLPRRNPFDLPYDSNEEKPDLKGDSFQQEFSVFKEPVYRRNETFSIGASVFPKHERQDFRWRPYFVPERFSSEEGTGYPTFHRQLSENSESKVSSVPDTESVNSAVDEEDKQSQEQIPEHFSSEMTYTTFQRQVSGISESKVSSVPDIESVSSAVDEEENKLNERDISREMEVISNIGHGVDHVECESQSSEEVGSVGIKQAEYKNVLREVVEITLGEGENHHEKDLSFSGTEGTSTPEEFNANEIHQKTEPRDVNSSRSSLSSLSQGDEKTLDMKKEGSTMLEGGKNLMEEYGVSTQIMPEDSEFHFMSGVTEHREPVYDSSPPGLEKFLSFTSISSDTQLEISEMGSSSVLLRPADTGSEVHREDRDNGPAGFEEMLATPTQLHAVDENESIAGEETVTDSSDHDVKNFRPLGIDPSIDVQKGSILSSYSSDLGPLEGYTVYRGDHFLPKKIDSVAPTHQTTSVDSSSSAPELQVPSMVVEHILENPSVSSPETEPVEEHGEDKVDPIEPEQDEVHLSSSSDKNSVEEAMTDKDGEFWHDADQIHSSSFDSNIPVDGNQGTGEEQNPPILMEQVTMVHLSLSSSEVDCVQEHSLDKEKSHQLDDGRVQSSSQEKIDSGLHQNVDATADLANSTYEDAPFGEKSPFELEKQLSSWSDQSLSYDDHDATQEAPIILTESMEEVNVANNANVSEVHDHGEKTLKNSSFLTSYSTSTPFQSPESRSTERVNIVNSGNAFEMHGHEHKTLKNSSPLTSDTCSTTPFQSPEDKSLVGEGVKYEILDRVVHGDPGHVEEHFDNSIKAYDPDVNEENINGVVDEIKEIDEKLLELDSVGDISVKEVGESLHIRPTPVETNLSNSTMLPHDSTPLETSLELPVLEAKSIQDIAFAFKQLNEGVDVEEVILPSMLENQVGVEESKDPGDNNSELPVVEARSVEDIHAALKQVSQSNLAEVPKSLESNDCSEEIEKMEVASTEQIESSSNGQAAVWEKSVTAVDDLNNVNQVQVPYPVENEAPVIQTENENPKLD